MELHKSTPASHSRWWYLAGLALLAGGLGLQLGFYFSGPSGEVPPKGWSAFPVAVVAWLSISAAAAVWLSFSKLRKEQHPRNLCAALGLLALGIAIWGATSQLDNRRAEQGWSLGVVAGGLLLLLGVALTFERSAPNSNAASVDSLVSANVEDRDGAWQSCTKQYGEKWLTPTERASKAAVSPHASLSDGLGADALVTPTSATPASPPGGSGAAAAEPGKPKPAAHVGSPGGGLMQKGAPAIAGEATTNLFNNIELLTSKLSEDNRKLYKGLINNLQKLKLNEEENLAKGIINSTDQKQNAKDRLRLDRLKTDIAAIVKPKAVRRNKQNSMGKYVALERDLHRYLNPSSTNNGSDSDVRAPRNSVRTGTTGKKNSTHPKKPETKTGQRLESFAARAVNQLLSLQNSKGQKKQEKEQEQNKVVLDWLNSEGTSKHDEKKVSNILEKAEKPKIDGWGAAFIAQEEKKKEKEGQTNYSQTEEKKIGEKFPFGAKYFRYMARKLRRLRFRFPKALENNTDVTTEKEIKDELRNIESHFEGMLETCIEEGIQNVSGRHTWPETIETIKQIDDKVTKLRRGLSIFENRASTGFATRLQNKFRGEIEWLIAKRNDKIKLENLCPQPMYPRSG